MFLECKFEALKRSKTAWKISWFRKSCRDLWFYTTFPLKSFSTVLKKCKDSITKKKIIKIPILFSLSQEFPVPWTNPGLFFAVQFLPSSLSQLPTSWDSAAAATTVHLWQCNHLGRMTPTTSLASSCFNRGSKVWRGFNPFLFFFNWKDTDEYSLLVLYQGQEFYLKDWKGIAN